MTRRLFRAALLAAAAAVPLAGCQTFIHRPKPTPAAPPPQVIMPTPEPSLTLPKPTPPASAPAPPRSCVPKGLGPPPRYPDTDAALRAAPGAADRYQLMAAGRILRQERLDELERAIAGCR
jgi:hypothetical protein